MGNRSAGYCRSAAADPGAKMGAVCAAAQSHSFPIHHALQAWNANNLTCREGNTFAVIAVRAAA
ncbi:MAG: hypothetical protein AAF613_07985 [Pseudomonadota bacterium]